MGVPLVLDASSRRDEGSPGVPGRSNACRWWIQPDDRLAATPGRSPGSLPVGHRSAALASVHTSVSNNLVTPLFSDLLPRVADFRVGRLLA